MDIAMARGANNPPDATPEDGWGGSILWREKRKFGRGGKSSLASTLLGRVVLILLEPADLSKMFCFWLLLFLQQNADLPPKARKTPKRILAIFANFCQWLFGRLRCRLASGAPMGFRGPGSAR
jgi:hypothetical protein